jgi:hypothetical protein
MLGLQLGEEISRCTRWYSKYFPKEGTIDLRSLASIIEIYQLNSEGARAPCTSTVGHDDDDDPVAAVLPAFIFSSLLLEVDAD